MSNNATWSVRPRFTAGDQVTIEGGKTVGHVRAPFYLRGLTGEVTEVHGAFRDPGGLAYHTPGMPPLTLYKVRLAQRTIWPDYPGAEHDTLEVDVYEDWLSSATKG